MRLDEQRRAGMDGGVPAKGLGPQTIKFTVAANAGEARGVNIVIAGQTFAVRQAGGCNYSLAPREPHRA